jgi:hypothetical protein
LVVGHADDDAGVVAEAIRFLDPGKQDGGSYSRLPRAASHRSSLDSSLCTPDA